MNEMRLSVIIAAYNEEENISGVIENIKRYVRPDTEIIVVDDGCTDNTAKVAKSQGAKVIKHAINQGKGASIRDGIQLAHGDMVLFIDGDGQDSAADIPRLIDAIQNGADFVNGSRWLGTLETGAISRLNFFITDMITQIIALIFNVNITDSQAGFRCFRVTRIKDFKLRSKEYEIETEMLIKAIKHNLKIVEVPVTRSKRAHGKTKLKRLRQGMRILRIIFTEALT